MSACVRAVIKANADSEMCNFFSVSLFPQIADHLICIGGVPENARYRNFHNWSQTFGSHCIFKDILPCLYKHQG